jgi:hypothetical protein
VKVSSPALDEVAIPPTLVEFTTIVYTVLTVTVVIELIGAFVTLNVAGDIPVVVTKLPINIPSPLVIVDNVTVYVIVVAVDVAAVATLLVKPLAGPTALLTLIVTVPAVVTEAAAVEFGNVIVLPVTVVTRYVPFRVVSEPVDTTFSIVTIVPTEIPVVELTVNVTAPPVAVNATAGTVIALKTIPADTLLSFQTATEPPTVAAVVPAASLNIVLESAPSNHNVHPPIVVGSKSHIFFDTGNTNDAIVYLKQSISVRCSAVYKN